MSVDLETPYCDAENNEVLWCVQVGTVLLKFTDNRFFSGWNQLRRSAGMLCTQSFDATPCVCTHYTIYQQNYKQIRQIRS